MVKVSPFDLIAAIEISHLHRSRSVFLDGLIRDTYRCGVIAMDGPVFSQHTLSDHSALELALGTTENLLCVSRLVVHFGDTQS